MLKAQIQRSCASISANIAEGCGRKTEADLAHFLRIAFASACELESHLLLAGRLGYLGQNDAERLILEVTDIKRMLAGFLNTLKAASG